MLYAVFQFQEAVPPCFSIHPHSFLHYYHFIISSLLISLSRCSNEACVVCSVAAGRISPAAPSGETGQRRGSEAAKDQANRLGTQESGRNYLSGVAAAARGSRHEACARWRGPRRGVQGGMPGRVSVVRQKKKKKGACQWTAAPTTTATVLACATGMAQHEHGESARAYFKRKNRKGRVKAGRAGGRVATGGQAHQTTFGEQRRSCRTP